MPPRYWLGWDIQEDLLIWYVFRDLLPAPVQDHLKNYWRAWLQPDLPTTRSFIRRAADAIDYWQRNHDWRGRASFFRDGYNFAVSTQNFNHTAAMGALLGGAMIDARLCHGRRSARAGDAAAALLGFLDGSTQEMLDHYYLSITLSAPEDVRRLRAAADRPADGPHPGRPHHGDADHASIIRGCAASSPRRGARGISGVLVEQDGIYGALHTVSKDGALNYSTSPPDAHGRRACRCGATTSRRAGSRSRACSSRGRRAGWPA